MSRKIRRHFNALTRRRRMSFEQIGEVAPVLVSRLWTSPHSEFELKVQQEVVDLFEGNEWFHGGLPGRAVGDLLLPSGITGHDPRGLKMEVPARLRHVFITPSLRVAKSYGEKAAGSVYRVEPQGELGVDSIEIRALILITGTPQFREMARGADKRDAFLTAAERYVNSFTCESARVVEVLE